MLVSWAWEERVERLWLEHPSVPVDAPSLSSWVPERPGLKLSAWHREYWEQGQAPYLSFLEALA